MKEDIDQTEAKVEVKRDIIENIAMHVFKINQYLDLLEKGFSRDTKNIEFSNVLTSLLWNFLNKTHPDVSALQIWGGDMEKEEMIFTLQTNNPRKELGSVH
jgi:hypothetical protein